MQEQETQNQQTGQQSTASQVPVKPNKSGGSKWWVWLLVVLGIFIIGVPAIFGGWFFFSAKSSPQYSLYKMDQAVKNKDYETFVKYFNVDSVIEDLLDKALESSEKEIAKKYPGNSEEAKMAKKYTEDLLNSLAPQMKTQAKEEIKKQVESGKFIESYSQPNIISAFLNAKVKMEGNDAVVTVTDSSTKKSAVFKMRKKTNYWEIYKIDMTLEELQKMSQ